MNNIFNYFVGLNLFASIFAISVILFRIISFKKLPKWLFHVLFLLVFMKFAVSLNISAPIGITEKVDRTYDTQSVEFEQIPENLLIEDLTVPSKGTSFPENGLNIENIVTREIEESKTLITVYRIIVSAMILALLTMYIFTRKKYSNLKKITVDNIHNDNRKYNVYTCDDAESPLVVGLFKEKILLPSDFDFNNARMLNHVLMHEEQHIKTKDNLFNLLVLIICIFNFFNPLVWICHSLLRKDMENSCDERVLREIESRGVEDKSDYAKTLLECAISKPKKGVTLVCTFGESNLKSRIKSITKFKRMSMTIAVICIVIIGLFVYIFATNGTSGEVVYDSIIEKNYEHIIEYVLENPRDIFDYKSREISNEEIVYSVAVISEIEKNVGDGNYPYSVGDSKDEGISINFEMDDISYEEFYNLSAIIFAIVENVEVITFKEDYLIYKEDADRDFGYDIYDDISNVDEFEIFIGDLNGVNLQYSVFEEMPRDYSIDMALDNGDVVYNYDDDSFVNIDRFYDFLDNYDNEEDDEIAITRFIDGKLNIVVHVMYKSGLITVLIDDIYDDKIDNHQKFLFTGKEIINRESYRVTSGGIKEKMDWYGINNEENTMILDIYKGEDVQAPVINDETLKPSEDNVELMLDNMSFDTIIMGTDMAQYGPMAMDITDEDDMGKITDYLKKIYYKPTILTDSTKVSGMWFEFFKDDEVVSVFYYYPERVVIDGHVYIINYDDFDEITKIHSQMLDQYDSYYISGEKN